jgi:hypothetical protein
MRQARAQEGRFVERENLCFRLQAAEGEAVDDARAVAFEGIAVIRDFRDVAAASFRIVASGEM